MKILVLLSWKTLFQQLSASTAAFMNAFWKENPHPQGRDLPLTKAQYRGPLHQHRPQPYINRFHLLGQTPMTQAHSWNWISNEPPLSPEEKQRRVEFRKLNNLCLWCGSTLHNLTDCPT